MICYSLFEGDDHRRQRRVMLPGFGAPESKAFLPLFKGCAESVGAEFSEYLLDIHQQCDV
jgi:cytochrome P450